MPIETRILTLHNATVTLYLLDEDGDPLLSAPVWSDARAEDLKLSSRIAYAETRPTGSRYVRRRAIGESHSISISRLWEAQFDPTTPTNDASEHMDRSARYALVITWIASGDALVEDAWLRRIYYGVTCEDYDLSSRDLFESDDKRNFSAEFFTKANGKGAPTAIA